MKKCTKILLAGAAVAAAWRLARALWDGPDASGPNGRAGAPAGTSAQEWIRRRRQWEAEAREAQRAARGQQPPPHADGDGAAAEAGTQAAEPTSQPS